MNGTRSLRPIRSADVARKGRASAVAALGTLLFLSCAVAVAALSGCAPKPVIDSGTDLQGKRPSGTVEMRQGQVAFIGSADAGSGKLHYGGKTYPFRVGGLGIGGIGISSIEAEGAVYHLSDVAQFGGLYVQGRYGFAVGEASRGDLWLQNGAGVIMHLRAKREGLILSLGADGVVVSLN